MLYRVEFHCHTVFSKDSLTRPDDLVAACIRKGIDRVVVTDHNTIAGARHAYEVDPQRVIVGEEIMTKSGELLAAFVREEVPPGLHPQDAIDRLRAQGAFISVSHPFDRMRKGHWELPDLLAIAPLVDAIETFNARCWSPAYNTEAQDFARQHGLPGTAGSDAHVVSELGAANLLLPPFASAEDLRRVIASAQPRVRLSPPWVHLFSRYAVWVKQRRNPPNKPRVR